MVADTPIVFQRTSPLMQGDDVRDLQRVLNYWGYTDDDGDALTDDGKCGTRTMQALRKFVLAEAEAMKLPEFKPETIVVTPNVQLLIDGEVVYEQGGVEDE